MNLQSLPIRVFNTLSGKEDILTTLEPDHLKMYVCGPTVYDRPHLGNVRSVIVYDLWFRFFKKVFSKVTYVRNITDVDDKINAAAKEQKISIQELAKKITELFYLDVDALNALRPTFEPRATEHIAEIITMIEQLIENGFAYESQGHVLFDVSAFKEYGLLSHRSLDEMIAGSRVEIASYKKDPLDFVLWKPADSDDDPSSVFKSPWGNEKKEGRPGWHIECSAMSAKYLGADFDIHGGGADLQFPHHENEIAQTRCAVKNSHFARFWIHNGFLTVNGEKMSKSLKNFITVRDLLDRGISGVIIRYLLLSTHYRKPFDYNEKALDDAKKSIEKFYSLLDENLLKQASSFAIPNQVFEYLAQDLNVAKVIAFMHELAKEIKSSGDVKKKQEMAATLDFLGLVDVGLFDKKLNGDEDFINSQIALRLKCKQEKDFAGADKIRKDLLDKGIALEDVAGGKTLWKLV